MNILLSGATGYLGRHLLAALLENGHQVVILKRSTSNLDKIQPFMDQIKSIDVDMTPVEQAFLFCKIDTVIHTATAYGRKDESIQHIISTNLNFPLLLLDAAIKNKVHTLMNTDTILSPLITPYALSKNQFHEWGMFYGKKESIRFLNIKLQNMYGIDDDETKLIPYVIKNCLQKASSLDFTSGEQTRDFIYIDDVVSAFLTLLDQIELSHTEHYQEVGIGSAQSVSVRTLIEKIGKLCQTTTQFNFGVLEARDTEFESRATDIRFLTSKGWRPRYSLEEGLKKTIAVEKERLCVTS
jgi:nucleoside-diphosphate-sugar epimerase